MPQSLSKRLNGNKEAFLKDVERFGDWEALSRWEDRLDGYHDYIGLRRFLYEETHDENFGRNPTATSYLRGGIHGLLREFIFTLTDLYFKERIRREKLERELDLYKADSKKREPELVDAMTGIMETVKALDI